MVHERRFAWRWHPHAVDSAVDYSTESRTLVTFTLEDSPDGGTLLRVVETGFDALPASRRAAAFAGVSSGWRGQLQESACRPTSRPPKRPRHVLPRLHRNDHPRCRRYDLDSGPLRARRPPTAAGATPACHTPSGDGASHGTPNRRVPRGVARRAPGAACRGKEATRLRDTLAADRRALPMTRVEKPYTFDGPEGRTTLRALFGNRRQLVVYHFMFDPAWEEGCKSCSYLSTASRDP